MCASGSPLSGLNSDQLHDIGCWCPRVVADLLCNQDVDRSRERERSREVVVIVESGKLEWL